MLLDLHTHILPGIDDGSADVEESRAMLNLLAEQGVERVCLTSHFYSDRKKLSDFLEKRGRAYRELLAALPHAEETAPFLLLGAEVFISRLLLSYEDLSPICLGDSSLMLCEMPFSSEWNAKVFDILDHLRYDYNITPVIAHVERYPAVKANPKLVDRLISSGYKIQVNIDSLLGLLRGRFSMKLVAEGKVDFLGSDCHNTVSRVPGWEAPLNLLQKKCPEALERIERNARLLFSEGGGQSIKE